MFEDSIVKNGRFYNRIKQNLTTLELQKLLMQNPYNTYCIANEAIEVNSEPQFTTFLVLYSLDFDEDVILLDISRQKKSTITTDLDSLTKGYIEFIDLNIVDRYPLALYTQEGGFHHENI